MTICIPKKPFMYLGLSIGYCLIFSWIPLLGLGIYGVVTGNIDYIGLLVVFWVPLPVWVVWFDLYNKDHKIVKWCDSSQQKNQEVKP